MTLKGNNALKHKLIKAAFERFVQIPLPCITGGSAVLTVPSVCSALDRRSQWLYQQA